MSLFSDGRPAAASSELDFAAVWHIKRRRGAKTWETRQPEGRREKTTVVTVQKTKQKKDGAERETEGNILQRRRKIEKERVRKLKKIMKQQISSKTHSKRQERKTAF